MDPVERFAALVAAPEPALDEGALAIAAGADPDLDPAPWLAELDRLAKGVTSLDGLLHRLFTEAGFAGNATAYYDPRNSLLPHVLTRRTGIPITLAVVAIEVGRRAGIELEGVGMPGHFLVRPAGSSQHLDVFAGGRRLDEAACETLFRDVTGAGPEVPFGPRLLARSTNRQILTRMLENLRVIYRHRRRPGDLDWVLRMRLALRPAHPEEIALLIDLARVQGELGRWLDGARLLDRYVAAAAAEPGSPVTVAEFDQLRTAARALRAYLN
ncbi:SirB1 family protein [Pseudonocardia hispaniensis]|uniref:SirB1 family protein n=1 Tax=Pseudonocardia hispaniensis TaxID=904933 RepID=A0ABW1IYW8_9PSEU